MSVKYFFLLIRLLGIGLLAQMLALSAYADSDIWDRDTAVARALSVSPTLTAARDATTAQRAISREAGRWPNPSIEITGGEKLGKDLGTDDWRIQEYAISQPIPIGGRLRASRRSAEQAFSAAQSGLQGTALEIEYNIAVAFHRLQWARERLDLTQSQVDSAQQFHNITSRQARVGDLSTRESLRLTLLSTEAESALNDAQREETGLRLTLLSLLELPARQPLLVTPLDLPNTPPALESLQQRQHPAVRAAQAERAVADARLSEAKASRIPDVNLRISREEDVFDGRREGAYAVGLEIEVPLWRSGYARQSSAWSDVSRAQATAHQLQREYDTALIESHTQLTSLRQQALRHQQQVLEPAQQVLAMTEQGYLAGELNLTELIDATQTHFRARQKFQDLLLEARLLEARLRFVSGQHLIAIEEITL